MFRPVRILIIIELMVEYCLISCQDTHCLIIIELIMVHVKYYLISFYLQYYTLMMDLRVSPHTTMQDCSFTGCNKH